MSHHDGGIVVTASPIGGARLTVTLPAANPAIVPAKRAPTPIMTTRRTFLLTGLAALAASACAVGNPATADAPAGTASPETTAPSVAPPSDRAVFVSHGPGDRPEVALTFHTNGDLRLARQLLDITTRRRVPITCFVVGSWLEQNPTWGRKLASAGHELANHTFTHPDVATLTASKLTAEINWCRDVLTRFGGGPGRYFRPSGIDDGAAPPSELVLKTAATCGYSTVLGFSVDPGDYQDPGASTVVARTLDNTRAGSIISLHLGHPGTIDALGKILDGIAAQNLQPVTVSKLLDLS